MDKNVKQIKPMLCPVCQKFYFTKLDGFDVEQLGLAPNTMQCSRCGWHYDLEQTKDPDLKNGANEMSLNEYKEWYKKKIKENPKWEYYQDFIGDPEPHLCPVCGEYEFEDQLCYDICPICGWEDNGLEVDPYDKNGGPSKQFVEHKKWFEEQRKLNPKYQIRATLSQEKEEIRCALLVCFFSRDKIKIRVFKARFSDLAYKADYWQGQSCPFLNRPIALVTLTYP